MSQFSEIVDVTDYGAVSIIDKVASLTDSWTIKCKSISPSWFNRKIEVEIWTSALYVA